MWIMSQDSQEYLYKENVRLWKKLFLLYIVKQKKK